MIPALLAGGFTALVLATLAWVSVDGLWRPDAFDYAQIGRELASGHGFSSRQAIYALHLEFLKEHGLLAADWPNLHRFPLPSLAMAAGFRLFGVGDAVVVGHGIVFQAATAALLFAWSRAALGLGPALACVALFSLNGALLEVGVSGLSEPPTMFFFTLALYATWRQGGSTGAGWSALAGVALGLAGLARTNALFVAPLFALALWLVSRRAPGGGSAPPLSQAARLVGAFAAGIVLVSLPWWWRNAALTGDPFFSLHSFFLLPSGVDGANQKWDLSVPWVRQFTSPLGFFAEHPGAVLAKASANLGRFVGELPALAGLRGAALLALVAAFVPTGPSAGSGLRPVARLLLASLAVNALLVSFTDFYLLKYHLHFVPGLVLLAVAVLWRLASRLPQPRLRAVVLVVALLLVADLDGTRKAFRRVPASIARYDRPHWDVIRRQTAPDALIVSDQSHAVAWETGRRSLRLHYDRDREGALVLGVLAFADRYLPVDAVYLSRQFLRDPGKREILGRTLAEQPRFRREFPHLHTFEGGGLLFRREAIPRSRARAGAPGSPDRPAPPDPP